MKNFLLIYRADYDAMKDFTDEQRQAATQQWMDWLGSIAAKGKLADRGNRLENTGKTLKANSVVVNGPFMEIKESIGGYSIITADSYDEALEISKSCPVFTNGGYVEIRAISVLPGK